MVLDDTNVHFNKNEGQILFIHPDFEITKKSYIPEGSVIGWDKPYYAYEA